MVCSNKPQLPNKVLVHSFLPGTAHVCDHWCTHVISKGCTSVHVYMHVYMYVTTGVHMSFLRGAQVCMCTCM